MPTLKNNNNKLTLTVLFKFWFVVLVSYETIKSSSTRRRVWVMKFWDIQISSLSLFFIFFWNVKL